MSALISRKKEIAVTALLASGGALLYYLSYNWRQKAKKGQVVNLELDIPNSVYNQVKQYAKESFAGTQIFLVETVTCWKKACEKLQQDLELVKVMGMDCEWITRDKKRRPVSMMQLSTLHCTVLIRMHLLEALDHIPESLVSLLEDKSILKVGVGALDDRDKLQCDYSISMRGCVDLRHMAGRHRKDWNNGGLKKFSEEIAGIDLDKSDELRRGNWESESLSSSMQTYAAKDSQAGLAVFLCLVGLKLPSTETYDSPTDLLSDVQKRSVPMCHGIVDLHYKPSHSKMAPESSDVKAKAPSGVNNSKSISSNALRSKSMYSNCVMQAPDGQVLCVCDAKKAQWYCDKGLADTVSEEGAKEMVIKLRFEPRGRPSGERDYYRSRKENICVVCGADKSFIRKNIVPREYRRHFPDILKSHSSHDVVLLCACCHKKTGVFDQQFKEHFAKLCNAPYKSGGVTVDSDLKKVKNAARTLSGYADKLPVEKLNECRNTLCLFYGTEEISDDVLESACDIDERVAEPQAHGSSVVGYFIENSTIQEFQRLWRLKFVESMSPKYLGDYWHIDYNHLDYLWVQPDQHSLESGSVSHNGVTTNESGPKETEYNWEGGQG